MSLFWLALVIPPFILGFWLGIKYEQVTDWLYETFRSK